MHACVPSFCPFNHLGFIRQSGAHSLHALTFSIAKASDAEQILAVARVQPTCMPQRVLQDHDGACPHAVFNWWSLAGSSSLFPSTK